MRYYGEIHKNIYHYTFIPSLVSNFIYRIYNVNERPNMAKSLPPPACILTCTSSVGISRSETTEPVCASTVTSVALLAARPAKLLT